MNNFNMIMKTILKNNILNIILICIITSSNLFAQQPDQVKSKRKISYVKVEVDGLACPFCAYGLEKKLKKIEGVSDVFIEIQDGSATFNIPTAKIPSQEILKKIVEDAGFKARKVTFSEQPFKSKADN